MSFRYIKGFGASVTELMEEIQGAASTTYVADSLVKMSAGVPVAVSGQTDIPYGVVVNVNSTPYAGQGQGPTGTPSPPLRPVSSLATTTLGERLKFVPTTPGLLWEVDINPILNSVVATGGSTTTAIVPYGGATGDLTGGFIYIKNMKWQGVITSCVVAGGAATLTFTPAAPSAVLAGMLVLATGYGIGSKVKLDATNPNLTISSAIADLGAGPVVVRGVSLNKAVDLAAVARVMFQAPI